MNDVPLRTESHVVCSKCGAVYRPDRTWCIVCKEELEPLPKESALVKMC